MADITKGHGALTSAAGLETTNPKIFQEFIAYDERGQPVVLRSNVSTQKTEEKPEKPCDHTASNSLSKPTSSSSILGSLRLFFDFKNLHSKQA